MNPSPPVTSIFLNDRISFSFSEASLQTFDDQHCRERHGVRDVTRYRLRDDFGRIRPHYFNRLRWVACVRRGEGAVQVSRQKTMVRNFADPWRGEETTECIPAMRANREFLL